MSTSGKGSDPGSGVVRNVAQDAVTTGVAIGSFLAISLPLVGPFVAAAGFSYLGIRAVKRGLRKKK